MIAVHSFISYFLLQVYVDTVGDPEKYRIKLTERFPSIKFVVAKKADSLYPVVSGASIVAKVNFRLTDSVSHCYRLFIYFFIQVTRDHAVQNWIFDETAENMHRNFGSGYPAGENNLISLVFVLA